MADIIDIRRKPEPRWWICKCGCSLFRIAPGHVVTCSRCGQEHKGFLYD